LCLKKIVYANIEPAAAEVKSRTKKMASLFFNRIRPSAVDESGLRFFSPKQIRIFSLLEQTRINRNDKI
jgi:hypothetical protein